MHPPVDGARIRWCRPVRFLVQTLLAMLASNETKKAHRDVHVLIDDHQGLSTRSAQRGESDRRLRRVAKNPTWC
jgi:hypothetical protein